MEVIISSREILTRKLQIVSNIVERRNTIPVTANVLIRGEGQNITFLSTDVGMQVMTQAQVGVQAGSFSTTVAARKMLDVIRSLPEHSEVCIKLDSKKMLVQAQKSRFSLQTLPADDFPSMQLPATWNQVVHFSQKNLKKLFNNVHYAMAVQDLRYYLNGVLMVFREDKILAVATDAHRLAYAESEHQGIENPNGTQLEAIIPRKTVQELLRLLGDSDERVTVSVGDNQVKFQFDDVELCSKLIEGKFPDFQKVLPTGDQKIIDLDRVQLLQGLQRASILTSDKFRGVRFQLDQGSLRVFSSNADQEEVFEELEVSYQGDMIDTGFNITYLIDVLSNLACEKVRISIVDSQSSLQVSVPDSDTFKYVVMPMRI